MQEGFTRAEQVDVEEIAEAQVVAAEAGQELDAELAQVARVFQAVQRLFETFCGRQDCGLCRWLCRGLQRRPRGRSGFCLLMVLSSWFSLQG